MAILRRHKKPLARQMHEATEIECSQADIMLNSKGEFNGHRVPRVVVEVGARVITQHYDGSWPGLQPQQQQPHARPGHGLQPGPCKNCAGPTRAGAGSGLSRAILDAELDREEEEQRDQGIKEWETRLRVLQAAGRMSGRSKVVVTDKRKEDLDHGPFGKRHRLQIDNQDDQEQVMEPGPHNQHPRIPPTNPGTRTPPPTNPGTGPAATTAATTTPAPRPSVTTSIGLVQPRIKMKEQETGPSTGKERKTVYGSTDIRYRTQNNGPGQAAPRSATAAPRAAGCPARCPATTWTLAASGTSTDTTRQPSMGKASTSRDAQTARPGKGRPTPPPCARGTQNQTDYNCRDV